MYQNYFIQNDVCIFPFNTPRKTASTGTLGGGIRTDLTAAVNINCQGSAYEAQMIEDTYEKELRRQVKECGQDPEHTTALSTAAWVELSAEAENSFQDLTVQAVVSGGIDYNGVAPGDPTFYYEKDGEYFSITESEEEKKLVGEDSEDANGEVGPKPGTVNLFLFINQPLTDAAMLRVLEMCGEAKAAAIRELLIGSNYSSELATGSGTDGCVIVSELNGDYILTDASGHSKLGELVGRTVKEAVKKALLQQTAACGARQFHITERVRRYGITEGSLWDLYESKKEELKEVGVEFTSAADLLAVLRSYNQNTNAVMVTALYVHMMDQCRWNLIMPSEVMREGRRMLTEMLYWKGGKFLKEAYAEKLFDKVTTWSREELTRSGALQLAYYLILFLAAKKM